MATVYAPIAYGPLPLLAFAQNEDGGHRLAATGVHCDLPVGICRLVGS